jgi:hypothetical protein
MIKLDYLQDLGLGTHQKGRLLSLSHLGRKGSQVREVMPGAGDNSFPNATIFPQGEMVIVSSQTCSSHHLSALIDATLAKAPIEEVVRILDSGLATLDHNICHILQNSLSVKR